MKNFFLLILLVPTFAFMPPQEKAFEAGEWFKFRIHYGLVNAGYATLEVREAVLGSKPIFHAVGKGYTTGMSRLFFKVDDTYESYFDKDNSHCLLYTSRCV